MGAEIKRNRASPATDAFDEVREEMRAMEDDLGLVHDRLRSLLDPWAEARGARRTRATGLAAIDVEDQGPAFEIRADLPGIPKDRVQVRVVGQRLEIRGETAEETETARRHYVIRERASRGFERVLELPQPIVGSEVRARFEHGVLTLTVPKTRAAVEHRIPIP